MNKFAHLPPLTEDEIYLLDHVCRWGSDGYPIQKIGREWSWGAVRSVKGHPCLFKTKREAIESFEAFYNTLLDRSGEEARLRAEKGEI